MKKKRQNAQHEMNYNRTTVWLWLRVHRKVVGDIYIIQPMWNKYQTSFYYFRWSRRRRCCCWLGWACLFSWVGVATRGNNGQHLYLYLWKDLREISLSTPESLSKDEPRPRRKKTKFCFSARARTAAENKRKTKKKNLVGFVRVGRQIRKGVFFFFFFSLWLGREMRYTGTLWHSPAQPFFFLGIFCLHLRLFWPTHPQ
jgi:hypothetical protein